MKNICDYKDCTGCGLCIAVCSKNAISFQKGDLGHLYPKIDYSKCIDCGLCHKRCPSNKKPNISFPLKAYAAFAKDEQEYKTSTSGGAAAVFSNYIIEQGGAVYGCAVNNIDSRTLDIKHIRVTSNEDLIKLKGSKYVQSRITEILPLLKDDVKSGKKVLFIGTPCQVVAVKNLFPKTPDNLYLIDIICHGVPSLDLLQKHIRNKIGDSPIDYIRFRDNKQLVLELLHQKKKLYKSNLFEERYKDEYYNAFMDGFTYRASCHNCHYACNSRSSDITIGDFWGLGKSLDASMIKEHKEGISLLLPITTKGLKLINIISAHIYLYEREINEAIDGNDQLRRPKKINGRIRLFKILSKVLPFNLAYKTSILDLYLKKFVRKHILRRR